MSYFQSILVLLVVIFSFNIQAFEFNFSGNKKLSISPQYTARYRNESGRNRAQQRVILKFAVDLDNNFKIIAVGGNGTSFSSSYDTFFDSTKGNEFSGEENIVENFAIKNLYIERQFENELVIQAGAVPTEKGIKSITALESNGWVDGFRIKTTTKLGDIKITAGSLTDPSEINVFERDRDINYFELILTREVYENLLLEIGYEFHDDNNYITLAHQQKVALASDKIITFVSEALIDVDNESMKASIGIKGDFIDLLTNRTSGISFELRTNYVGDDIGSRGGSTYSSGFSTSKGHYYSISAKFNISKKNKVSGYCRYRKNYDEDIGDERFECGITKKH